jgi:polysaccharide biosynthesis transport protein
VVSLVVALAAAFAYAKLHTPTYQSSALVQINTPAQGGTAASSLTLPDPVQELGSSAVQLQAAKLLGNPDVAAATAGVTGTVDATTGALTITATAPTAEQAQALAKAYSTAFVDQIGLFVQAQINKIGGALAEISAKIATLQSQPGSSVNPLITEQVAAYTQTYASLQTEQSNIQLGVPYASVQVAADLPGKPTGLGKSKLLAIGVLAGLLVGCGIALVREQFDDRLRNSPEIESVIDAPVLAELPQDDDVRNGKVAIAIVQAPQSPMAESIRELRTSLRVLLDQHPCPVLVVTSPEPGDGKTFVTANLAAAWARSGSKVIAVSADFRRPRLEEVFGIDTAGRPGLADVIKANWKSAEPDGPGGTSGLPPLRGAPRVDRDGGRSARRDSDVGPPRRAPEPELGDTSVAAHLVETGIQGLQLLPVGTFLDSPSELFGSPGMQPVIDQLPLLADIVLLDTPPVLSAPDTAILGSMAHGAVLVATEGRTDRTDLERTVHRLETTNCHVLGLVLNHVRRMNSDGYRAYAYRQ